MFYNGLQIGLDFRRNYKIIIWKNLHLDTKKKLG